ncbi:MAG: hypothetical protein ACXW2E_01630 [Nitrososphaeraceae archaeon]
MSYSPKNPNGQATKANSTPVVIASDDDVQGKLGSLTETSPATDTTSSGLNGRLQRIAQRLTSLIALLPSSIGQQVKSASLAVTVASDDDLQGKLGSLTETSPATDTASSGLNGRLQRIAQRLTSLTALLPASLGQTTKTASLAVTVASDDDLQGKLGSLTETAPSNDVDSSGLNGRLQRIAQRLTTIIAALPTTIGQKAKAASLAVTIASDDDLQDKLGIVTETSPGTDTASSGLNGRLQRIAQRLTSLIALLPTSLTGSGNYKVAVNEAIVAGANIIGKIGIDQTTPGTTDSVTVKTGGYTQTVTITRPSNTDAYEIKDAVGDTGGSAIIEFTGVGRPNEEVFVDTIIFGMALAALPTNMTAGFEAHIFKAAPTAIADNAAFSLQTADITKFQKTIPINIPVDYGASLISQNTKLGEQVTCSSTGSLFIIFTSLSAFTPGSASQYPVTIHTFGI